MKQAYHIYFQLVTCFLAFSRGPGQKVVSFSYYVLPPAKRFNFTKKAEERQYFEGIADNLKSLPEFYPGHVMRVYHDLREDSNQMKVTLFHYAIC